MVASTSERKDGVNKKLNRKSYSEVKMARGHINQLGYLQISSVKKSDWGPPWFF